MIHESPRAGDCAWPWERLRCGCCRALAAGASVRAEVGGLAQAHNPPSSDLIAHTREKNATELCRVSGRWVWGGWRGRGAALTEYGCCLGSCRVSLPSTPGGKRSPGSLRTRRVACRLCEGSVGGDLPESAPPLFNGYALEAAWRPNKRHRLLPTTSLTAEHSQGARPQEGCNRPSSPGVSG